MSFYFLPSSPISDLNDPNNSENVLQIDVHQYSHFLEALEETPERTLAIIFCLGSLLGEVTLFY